MNPRRITVIVVVGVLLLSGISGAAHQSVSSSGSATPNVNAPPTDSYVIEQGSFCQPIEPLSSGETIESFYEYRSHETHSEDVERYYSSYGTTHLQRNNTSTLFLHEGPNGMSLGMVHGRLDTGPSGGVVTFDLVGLPHDSEWVVKDDNYTGPRRMDEFNREDGLASASWIYQEGRTDGGAVQGGFDGDFAVTVQPAFNDESAFADNESLADPDFNDGGEIEEWDIVSGSAENPDRTTLPSLDEPVTIRTGTCEDPSITYDRTNNGITAIVENADPDDRITLQPTTGTDDGVQFERVEVSGIDGDASFSLESHFSELSADPPAGVEPLSYLNITSESGDSNVSGTVSFTVEKKQLEDRNIEPSELALYEKDGKTWTETSTSVHGESNDTYRFTANVTQPSTLAVAPERSDDSMESAGLFGIGVGVTAGAVLGLGWMVASRVRNR